MSYLLLKGHKGRGECQKGQIIDEEEDAVMAEYQPNAK